MMLEILQQKIYEVRAQNVMFDLDLAELWRNKSVSLSK